MKQSGLVSKEGYFAVAFTIILSSPERSTGEFIARSLCATILPRFDDFTRDYKKAGIFKDCQSFSYALAKAFAVEVEIIDKFLERLQDFKNIQDQIACMSCAKPFYTKL